MTRMGLDAIGLRAHALARRSGASIRWRATRPGRLTRGRLATPNAAPQATNRNPCANTRTRKVSRRLSAGRELCAFRLGRVLAVLPNAPGPDLRCDRDGDQRHVPTSRITAFSTVTPLLPQLLCEAKHIEWCLHRTNGLFESPVSLGRATSATRVRGQHQKTLMRNRAH
jgi:hypothetical protein